LALSPWVLDYLFDAVSETCDSLQVHGRFDNFQWPKTRLG
jgi:hypothetical protein